jgi:GTP-binding protein
MIIKSAAFVSSAVTYTKCPSPDFPEYAFIGRSNVGKSSLINMLCGKKKLAKTSSKPGKTQLINHFIINENWYIVDLPGYGFAKASKTERKKWENFITDYLLHRENLMNVFVLIDSRLEPQKNDIDFVNFLGKHSIPFTILFTKADKLSLNKVESNIAAFKKVLLKTWEEFPMYIITSSETKMGREEMMDYIAEVNTSYHK